MSPTVLNNGFIRTPGKTWGQGPLFTFGLMSFLVTRYADHADNLGVTYPDNYAHLVNNEAQWRNYNATAGDQARDVGAINGWLMHLGSIYERRTSARYTMYESARLDYTNRYLSVWDEWGTELNYQSDPPYMRYRLWSNGPDRISGTSDDLSTGAGY
jgi:hypothetical protein